jgi:Glycosyl transferases group 1
MYHSSDAFVLASTKEPYGTVYGEAMAAGLPVVGWRAGNLPHLAEHEREALIVELGEITGLSTALQRLAQDEALRARLGEAARHRAQSFRPGKTRPELSSPHCAHVDRLRRPVRSRVQPVFGALGELANVVSLQPVQCGGGVLVVAKRRIGPVMKVRRGAPDAPLALPFAGVVTGPTDSTLRRW